MCGRAGACVSHVMHNVCVMWLCCAAPAPMSCPVRASTETTAARPPTDQPTRYANRAKNITNKPRVNEDPKDAMLREFQEEIARLREQLEVGRLVFGFGGGVGGWVAPAGRGGDSFV